ncbi:type I restriction modification DNA specificity domain protein [Bacteroides fragilis str. 3988 T1]|uniref:restriction endonuclease subunit S n=1 Tax=Bacteroides fragilis TaxID=817 RepID=UPI0004502CD7|nr:restriction endonuclease subunit S [Bacteroides fragilis]EXY78205.1 type I restriction modification DNA specificity domain protein [Bacteroides fragilis str. 3988 T1]
MRFPEFTEEWNYESLDTIAPNITSGRSKPSLGEYNLYGSTGIIGKTATADYSGDMLLVARVGANAGSLQLVNDSCGITDNTLIIKPCKLSSHYLYFYLQHYNLNRLVFGSGQPLITAGMLKKVRIPFGNQLEQKKIENFLCCIDERITTQNKIIEKLETLIKGICNKSLYTVNGTAIQLGDILIERRERTVINNQYEVLSSTVKGIFSQREYFSKDIASENNVGYKIIRLHDVVLSPQNLWMGNVNYNDNFEVGIVSPSYKVFSIAENLDKRYIATLLKTHRALYNYMLVSEQGASIVRRNLNMEAFEQITFKIPPLSKQEKIGNAISILQARITSAIRIKTAYEAQKQWLLTQMFI